jgi:HD-GYP domain-containing protein (c-di-GMP phosphodiesterase class II)
MPQLLIWGDPREILSGDLPPGVQSETISDIDGLTHFDGRGPSLVLADARRLEPEAEKLAAWAHDAGVGRPVLLAVIDGQSADDVLSRMPFVDDAVERPVTPLRLRRRLDRAIETVKARRSVKQLEDALSRKGAELSELNKIGVALSAERDIDALLALILSKSREITSADAGSLYLVERTEQRGTGDRLRFELAQNDTVDVPFKKRTMPLDHASIAGHVALTGRVLNLPDAYQLPLDSPFQISRDFDARSGYRTKSVLVVPMRDHQNAIIGAVQLINKKRDPRALLQPVALVEEEVVPFTSVDEELASSLASQAAVAFENAKLLQDIRTLFDRFVRAAAKAVEARDPVTSGHSERVAELTVALAEKVDRLTTGPYASLHFTREQVQEIRYAGLLHDFGKVAVQEKYLCKEKKLYATELIGVRQRFAYILKARETSYLRARLDAVNGGASPERLAALESEFLAHRAEIQRTLETVLAANEPTVVEEDRFSVLMNLPTRRFDGQDPKSRYEAESRFPVENWAEPPYLSEDEVKSLSIRRGSLDAEERMKIEKHVTHTYEFLRQIPWTGDLAGIPLIAWAHHEKLDGSGYPRGIEAADIPPQSRMMTIADIFDALVALDRPYKKAQPVERALRILDEEARSGKLDADLLRVFVDAELYKLQAFTDKLLPRAER